jgi:hypothetical protein
LLILLQPLQLLLVLYLIQLLLNIIVRQFALWFCLSVTLNESFHEAFARMHVLLPLTLLNLSVRAAMSFNLSFSDRGTRIAQLTM